MKYYVYVHKKSTTGEVFYVGKGKGTRAFHFHGRSAKWNAFHAKYGTVVEQLAFFDNEAEAFEYEKFTIAMLRRAGFNLTNHTDGGEGTSGLRFTPAQKSNLSDIQRQTWLRPGYRDKHREAMLKVVTMPEYRTKQSAISAARWGDPEYRARASATALRGGDKPNARAVVCIETSTVFETITAATDWLHLIGIDPVSKTSIVACCKERMHSCYGFHWHYAENPPDAAKLEWIFLDYAKGARHCHARAVACPNSNMTFPTITSASQWLNSIGIKGDHHSTISECCTFKQRHVAGYNFHYVGTPPNDEQRAWQARTRSDSLIAVKGRAVVCIETGVTFNSISTATRWLHANGHPTASTSNISSHCRRGIPKSSCGYHWRYAIM
jgi:hypothetical protein